MRRLALFTAVTVFAVLAASTAMARTAPDDPPSQEAPGVTDPDPGADSDDPQDNPGFTPNIVYVKGEVLKVETITSVVDPSLGAGDVKQISQIRIAQGAFSDRIIYDVTNYVLAKDPKSIELKVGVYVMLALELDETSRELVNLTVYDYYRLDKMLYTAVAVCLFFIGATLLKGVRTLAVMLIVALALVYFFVPLVVRGVSPILAGAPICLMTMLLTVIWHTGLSSKGFAAILGALVSLFAVCVFSMIIENMAHLVGLGNSEVDILAYIKEHSRPLSLSGLMSASSMLAASGGIAETVINIVENMESFKNLNPYINLNKLFVSGISAGQAYMGRSLAGLFLVMISVSLPLVVLNRGLDTPIGQILNMDAVAISIFRVLAVMAGVLVALPATSYFYALMSKRRSIY